MVKIPYEGPRFSPPDYAGENRRLKAELQALRRGVDNIKIRSYELGQRELHDMALAALLEVK